jgi:hypothetical protein
MTVQERIDNIAARLGVTPHGNPRLDLDIRFYGDGHVSIGSPRVGDRERVQRDDLAAAVDAIAEIVRRADRNAKAN